MRARSIIYEPTHCSATWTGSGRRRCGIPEPRRAAVRITRGSGLRLLHSDPEWRRKAA